MIEFKTYKNASNIPDGKYQNHDRVHHKFLVKVDSNSLFVARKFSELRDVPLTSAIYYNPSHFPRITKTNYLDGTCFVDWYVPPASFIFQVKGHEITVVPEEKNLSLSEYHARAYDHIVRDITTYYATHDIVTLFYSGGIDSMTILSFISKLGLLPRTRLLYYRNATQDGAIYKNPTLASAVAEVFSRIGSELHGIDEPDELCNQDVANLANTFDYDMFTPYSTTTYLTKYLGTKFLTGYMGNSSMLHHHIFIDQRLRQTGDYVGLKEAQQAPNLYCYSLADYTPVADKLMDLDNFFFQVRPWIPSMSFNGGNLCSPLGSVEIIQDLRRLRGNDIEFIDVLNATLPKAIIEENTGSLLLDCLTVESLSDADNLENIHIPIEMLSESVFYIPKDIIHNPEGLQWLDTQLKEMREIGFVPINTLVSFKAIQRVSALVNGAYNYEDVV
jgi:hypothetical protein